MHQELDLLYQAFFIAINNSLVYNKALNLRGLFMIVVDTANMVIFPVQKKYGSRLLTAEQGQAVYSDIKALLDEGKTVSLNFKDVAIIGGPFLNNAIGVLYKDFSESDLLSRLHYTQISQHNLQVIRMVTDNSIKFYHKYKGA